MSAKPPDRVLLIALQQIGDVLLSTPLLHSLRMAWPQARIDVLVFEGTGSILDGNPDCSKVIEVPRRGPWRAQRHALCRIFRAYDLAVTTQAGDKSHLYALAAAPRRAGLIADRGASSLWKRWSCNPWVWLDDLSTHTVIQNLTLAKAMGLSPCPVVIPPRATTGSAMPFDPPASYAVIHPYPMWRYKRWPEECWLSLIYALNHRGLFVLISGGPDPQERTACARLAAAAGDQTVDASGRLSFSQLATLLRGARLYVGPDTVTTHLAAACGTPTAALFGPSNPVKWGPWPAGASADGNASPYVMSKQPWQRAGNVALIQGPGTCVPCRLEGCERHKGSHSRCMDELTVSVVLEAITGLLQDIPPCAS